MSATGVVPTVAGGELMVTRADGVLRIVITREARRNALSAAVLNGMQAALESVIDSDRVVLLASLGPVFCSGLDLTVNAPDATGLALHEARGGVRRVMLAMRACPVPVLAKVQGLCLAGGVGLLLGTDLAIAADTAAFGLPEVDRGLWPFQVSALLARQVPPKVAMDLMISGERIGAERALALGLLSRVVAAPDLDVATETWLESLIAKPPIAVRLGKAAFIAAQETAIAPALEAMQAQLSLLTTTKDAQEGIAAFFDKRPPRYSGQ